MEAAVVVIKWLITYLAMPAIVICIFGFLGALNYGIISSARPGVQAIRYTVAAALPFVLVVFVVAGASETTEQIAALLEKAGPYTPSVVSAALALILLESACHLEKVDFTAVVGAYVLFVSTLLALLLLALLGGAFPKMTFAMMAFVAAGGVYVVFRGLPSYLVSTGEHSE